jgi:hypothetical protein
MISWTFRMIFNSWITEPLFSTYCLPVEYIIIWISWISRISSVDLSSAVRSTLSEEIQEILEIQEKEDGSFSMPSYSTMFHGTDQCSPKEVILESLWYLNTLFLVDWSFHEFTFSQFSGSGSQRVIALLSAFLCFMALTVWLPSSTTVNNSVYIHAITPIIML